MRTFLAHMNSRNKNIFKEGKRYTFSDYFDMSHPTAEIVHALGYSLTTQIIKLHNAPEQHYQQELERISTTYYNLIPKISLNSEAAKREIMIAPVLQALLQYVNGILNIEYSIDINDKLSGTIDYLMSSSQELIVIEAKKGDLERGFNQLAAEMIALDLYDTETELTTIYGAITIGEVWRFALLERATKHLIKDVHTFRFPEDLQQLFAILLGIVNPPN